MPELIKTAAKESRPATATVKSPTESKSIDGKKRAKKPDEAEFAKV